MTKLFERLVEKRGLTKEFIHPEYEIDPLKLPDIEKAAHRIYAAIDAGEKILIYGDYDADGVTATALMYEALTLAGAKEILTMLPDRFKDGYGMSERLVSYAKDEQVSLVVTVDCGSNNAEIISELKGAGIDTVVTDHHELMHGVPKNAAAVVNAHREDKKVPKEYQVLCGCGTAFVLAAKMMMDGRIPKGQEKWMLDLAMIGTVCDSMELTGVNRVICYYGMKVLPITRRPGLKALLQAAKIKTIDTFAVGFGIGPRLNAAGRLESADLALKLLMTKSKAEGAKLARQLDELNSKRKTLQQTAVDEISEWADFQNDPVIVVRGKYHEGIVGIIAGRLTEKYHKPAFVLTEVTDGVLKGSGRSFGDFSLAKALSECQSEIMAGGGHAGACGVKVLTANFERFKQKINDYYRSLNLKKQEKYLAVQADLDVTELSNFNVTFMKELRTLEPFGEGNQEPVFRLPDMFIVSSRRVGAAEKHLQLTMRDGKGHTMRLVAFSAPEEWLEVRGGVRADACIQPVENEWRGEVSVEGRVLDLKLLQE